MKTELTAIGSGYYVVLKDLVEQSQHVAEREAIEKAINLALASPLSVVTYEHRYVVTVAVLSDDPTPTPDPDPVPDQPPPDPIPDPVPDTPLPPGTLPNGLVVVDEATWNPSDLKHITNRPGDSSAAFASKLQSPNLWWADSLRPLTDDIAKHKAYYVRRDKDGNGTENPYVSYDASRDGMRQEFRIGDKGIPGTNQSRILWPLIGPDIATMCSVQFQMRYGIGGPRGGKQIQVLGSENARLHFELNTYGGYGTFGDAGNWERLPAARTYFTEFVGGRGLNEQLVGGSAIQGEPGYCSGASTCPIQPNLGTASRNATNLTDADHISNGGQQYLVGDETLSGWVTYTITFDWRDPANHKAWMHIEDERTPRTLVIGLLGDGYPLRYTGYDTPIRGLLVEFNNSSTVNDSASEAWLRNVLVFKNKFVFEE